MKTIALTVVAVVVAATVLAAQESPYVGLEERSLKALSEEQIEDLLEGRGMGLALAAELNGYPGPKHVLELATEIGLDDAQEAAMRDIFERMRSAAVELGQRIVEHERALDRSFAEGRIEATALEAATEEIGRLSGQLRGVHLAAHLEARAVLTPEQRHRYVMARGYGHSAGEAGGHDPSKHHR